MKLYYGKNGQKLAQKICDQKSLEIGNISLKTYANQELRVKVNDKPSKTSAVVQSLSNPIATSLLQMNLIADSLKRLGASRLIAVVPYLGYSKQDKVFLEGESLSVKVVAKMIQAENWDRIYVFNLHNQAIMGFFDCPLVQLNAYHLFVKDLQTKVDSKTVVVAPDAGSIKSSREMALKLNLPLVYLDKKRDLKTGKVKYHGISSSVKNKKALIFDDIISTGGTLTKAASFLKSQGAKTISAFVVHHLYVNGVQEKIDQSSIDRLLVADTVSKPKNVRSKKLKVISVSSLISERLKND